ncbi:MAG: hypothetical protein LBC68_06435 [Prevotellaceae bacterium]|nr:hypothetical protein [Prevotellaceae bacterium]
MTSCNSDEKNPIKSILTGTYVEHYSSYEYSDDFYIVNNDTISLRSKIKYDKSGNLLNLILYKPEGALNYTNDNVLNDMSLLQFACGNYIQTWNIVNDTLLINDIKSLKVQTHYKQNGEKIMISMNDNQITIFELY